MQPQTPNAPDLRNLIIAIGAATIIMLGWQYFYERPRLQAVAVAQKAAAKLEASHKAEVTPVAPPAHTDTATEPTGPRIRINSAALHGSIALHGARFDDLTLAQYHETTEPASPEVRLLSPATADTAYFSEIGVLPADTDVRVPDANTQWQSDSTELTPERPVTLRWNNGAGLTFEKKIALDTHYLFTITTTVKNTGAKAVTLYPYALVSRNYTDTGSHTYFMHEGPLGVVRNALEDITYKKLREDGPQKFENTPGWIGMTDKYWLAAVIPEKESFDAGFKHFKRGEHDAYQSDLRGEPLEIAPGTTTDFTMHLFAGAKEVKLLDAYRAQFNIPLFDRAVDFGSLYFLTKPFFLALNYFHSLFGNFGIAILLLTICVKLVLFPLANKSLTSMARTKQLMPKVTELRERYGKDKMKMNQEIMALYKREKVNPAAGCLPLLLQIPVFLALYRVLFVTIEMRQAPFFGWIHDLSAPDPTNIFTVFGLIPWDAPHFLHLGIWPMVMCVTMVIQQRLNPKPADEVQAMVMNYMPFMFLFLFAGFPAGLVIYWAWNNTLTILQQLYINRGLTKKGLR
ncbi:MAG: membrane protein insertase YidC [Rickettsiales bacterium]